MKLGSVEIASPLALAPMAGVTDLAFRTICRHMGAGYTVTEMVSAKALCYQDKKSIPLMELAQDEHPAAVQLFGSDPGCMEEAAAIVMEKARPDVIDINMGCPVPKVVKSGDGSALMRDPLLAAQVAKAVIRGAGGTPVTCEAPLRVGQGFHQLRGSGSGPPGGRSGGGGCPRPYQDPDVRRPGRLEHHPRREGDAGYSRHGQRRHFLRRRRRTHSALYRGGHGDGGPGRVWKPMDLSRRFGRAGGRAASAASHPAGTL